MAETKKEQVYELIVEAKRIKGERDGKNYNFLSYEGVQTNGKKCRFKFTKDCNECPEEEGTYKITVDKRYINKDKSSVYNIYWIREVIDITDYEQTFADNEDDLPF